MATVVNARDVQIQSQLPRVATVTMQPNLTVDQSQVTGLGLVVEGTKMVYLQASTQVFQIAKSGTITPASTTLTAVLRNLTAAASLSVVSGTITPAPTLVGGQVTINATAMTTDAATIRVSVVEGGKTYTDDITIIKVREGADGTAGTNGVDALVGFLTNESHSITADYLGNPLSYSGATGTFKVFKGTTDITTLCTFALVSGGNPSGLTHTIGATTGIYTVTGGYPVGTDLTTLTFRATFGTSTLDKTFTLGKQKAPTPSKTLVLGTDKQVFTFTSANTAFPTSQTISLAAAGQNLSGNPSWTATLFDSSNVSLGAATLGGLATDTTRTLTVANYGTSAAYAKVTVTWDGLTDTTTIVKLTDGAAGTNPITALLTNEAMVVSADAAGTVTSFANAGGTMKVYEGIVDKTGNVAVTYSVQASAGVTISIASTGVYTVTAMSADTGTATLRAVYNGVTIDKNYAIAKSKAGAGGVTNVIGFLTNEATVVPTANDGTGGVYTNAGGTFKVFEGITDKTGVGVTYSVAASSGVTISISATGAYTVTALSTDSGTATLRAVYNGVTLDKLYSIAKSKAGPTGTAGTNGTNGTNGLNAQVLFLSSTAQTFTYDKLGALSPSSQTISFTANLQNLAGTATFTATPYNSAGVAGAPITMGGTGNTRTLTGAQFGTNAYVSVVASLSGLSDTITVVRLKDGADGSQGAQGPQGPAGTNGTNGTNGVNGQRGSRTWYVALTGTTSIYSTTLATTTASADGGPVLNDTVTQYNNSQNFSETRFWNGTAWVQVNAVVDGNLLVDGTVGAQALSVTNLAAVSGDLGTVQINANGYLRSAGVTSYSVGTGFFLGYDAAAYKFRVGNPSGDRIAWDGTALVIQSPKFSLTAAGDANFGGAINVGNFTGYAWPAGAGNGAHLSGSGLMIGNATLGKYFNVDANGNVFAPGFSISNGALVITSGIVRNSTNTAALDLNASGLAIAFRAGSSTYWGPYVAQTDANLGTGAGGWHYDVEIRANGKAFFKRDVVMGGGLRASGSLTVPIAERPAVYFFTSVAPPPDTGGT